MITVIICGPQDANKTKLALLLAQLIENMPEKDFAGGSVRGLHVRVYDDVLNTGVCIEHAKKDEVTHAIFVSSVEFEELK